MLPPRHALLSLALLLAPLAAAAQSDDSAGAASPPADLASGDWDGSYRCTQGLTALHLTIATAADGRLSAVFAFSALPTGNAVPSGSFTMQGDFDRPTRTITLRPQTWLVQPDGYVTVGMKGRLECAGTRLRGTVVSPYCTTFELTRAGAPPCERRGITS